MSREVPFPAPWLDKHVERIGGWKLVPQALLDQWQELFAEDLAQMGAPRPLVFTSRRQRRKLNAQLDFLGAENDVLLHPDDAATRGIADGDRVRASNDQGTIELIARIDKGMRRGVASLAHGHLAGNVNRLTSKAAIDPISGMALYSGVPLEIAPKA